MEHFADRVAAAVEAKQSPICVGLDPVIERLPEMAGPRRASEPTAGLHAFCLAVVDAVAEHVPVVKLQSACFERYAAAGWAVMLSVIDHAKSRGLIVILDAKRGDVGHSAKHYAQGLLGQTSADALTVNPFLGMDTLEPFAGVAAETGKGLFVLVRTSNPGSDRVQGLRLDDGRTVSQAIADQVAELGEANRGRCGYSSVGAVVGATHPRDAAALRARMPRQIFLVPGFGAQGGDADDVRACFAEGRSGALVSASRSVIYAHETSHEPWTTAVESAAKRFKDEVNAVVR